MLPMLRPICCFIPFPTIDSGDPCDPVVNVPVCWIAGGYAGTADQPWDLDSGVVPSLPYTVAHFVQQSRVEHFGCLFAYDKLLRRCS
jgi:hypothetical protein